MSGGNRERVDGEFQSQEEITRGYWFEKGKLNQQLIEVVKKECMKKMKPKGGATLDDMQKDMKFVTPAEEIAKIVNMMDLDKEIKVEKRGGKTYYYKPDAEIFKEGMFSSIPCGMCPVINQCTPNGRISPATCVHYNKWLALDF